MPELPEVERTVRTLRPQLVRHRLLGLVSVDPRILVDVARARLARIVDDVSVRSFERRGKYMLLELSGDGSLILHLRMSGKLLVRPDDDPPKFSRLAIQLAGAKRLHLADPRVLAKVVATATTGLASYPPVAALGPDPLAPGFDGAALGERLTKRKQAVKIALMDQRVVAGIGNIQATEALWKARIHPLTAARSLGPRELARLAAGIRWTLSTSLTRERGEEIVYVSESRSANPFVVYGRAGSPCPRCGTTLERSVVGGRGTATCPSCQPAVASEARGR